MRAVLFDFDGLILDTETPELRAWEREFARHGATLPDGYWASTIGRGADQVEEWPLDILQRLVGPLPDAQALEDRVKIERLRAIEANPILPGVRELMEAAIAEGVRVGVVSSSMHPWVDGNLARLGLAHLVEKTTCRGDAPRAKPFPDLYELACARFDLRPDEARALEDSPNGSAAALAAGIPVAVVPNPVTEGLDFPAGIHRVTSMTDITLSWLRGLSLG